MSKRTYLVTYWRNDGEWHTGNHNYNPTSQFYANNDDEALRLAVAYAQQNRRGNEDFWLSKLREVKIREVVFDKEIPFKGVSIPNLEEKLKEAEFEDFE